MAVKIGITESSDPCFDKTWIGKIERHAVDGIVIVTKGLAHDGMIEDVLHSMETLPTVLHCTCTGWGGTVVEPGVPAWEDTLAALETLIRKGFPVENVVLRIDPIIPEGSGLDRVDTILFCAGKIKGLKRVRVSVLDNYPHVRTRFRKEGIGILYSGSFTAPDDELIKVIEVLQKHKRFTYEACAETKLCKLSNGLIKAQGCISMKELDIMGIDREEFFTNPQNRRGCCCLSCKTELLQRDHACPHHCLYCYWKRPGE